MIARMQKLLLAGRKELLPEVLAFVQGQSVFQVEKFTEEEYPAFSQPQAGVSATVPLERDLSQIDSILLLLPPPNRTPSAEAGMLPPLEDLQQEVSSLHAQLLEKEEEQRYLTSYRAALNVLLPLLLSLEGSQHLEALGFLSTPRERTRLNKLREELEKELPNQYQWLSQRVSETLQAEVIAYPKTEAARVKAALGQNGFSEFRLPAGTHEAPPEDAARQVENRLEALPGEIAACKDTLARISFQQRRNLIDVKGRLLDRVEREKAQQAALRSHYAFLLSGWIPLRSLAGFQRALAKAFNDQVALQVVPLDEHEMRKAPILLQNKPLFQPFELLMSIFRPPRYDRIDPTPIVGFFFPLFFGLIIGDIGYGLLFLLPMLYLFFRSKPGTWKSVALIGILCSIWTVLFGVLFGEFFGKLGGAFGIFPLLIDRESKDGILSFLLLSLGIGVLQIFLGFGLEIYLSLRERAYREAFEAVFLPCWIIGLLLALVAGIGLVPGVLLYIGLGLLVISWIGVIVIKGPILGLTEPLSTTGNILSYSRLMGIGVSSAYLAYAANQIGGLLGNPVIGFLVGAICHLLFLVLGIISPIIQSARLHVVEFFNKFKYHEYSGNPYKPLARVIQKGV